VEIAEFTQGYLVENYFFPTNQQNNAAGFDRILHSVSLQNKTGAGEALFALL